jgi:hypothetical protein
MNRVNRSAGRDERLSVADLARTSQRMRPLPGPHAPPPDNGLAWHRLVGRAEHTRIKSNTPSSSPRCVRNKGRFSRSAVSFSVRAAPAANALPRRNPFGSPPNRAPLRCAPIRYDPDRRLPRLHCCPVVIDLVSCQGSRLILLSSRTSSGRFGMRFRAIHSRIASIRNGPGDTSPRRRASSNCAPVRTRTASTPMPFASKAKSIPGSSRFSI